MEDAVFGLISLAVWIGALILLALSRLAWPHPIDEDRDWRDRL